MNIARSLSLTKAKPDCFPLPRPVDSEQQLQEVDRMEFSSLKANFVEEFFLLDLLVWKMASHRHTVGSHSITGAALCEMLVKYADSIRCRAGMLSAITEIPTQAQLIAKMASERALKAGKEMYISKLAGVHSLLPMHIDALHKQHVRIQ
jgi:hypothetical protein